MDLIPHPTNNTQLNPFGGALPQPAQQFLPVQHQGFGQHQTTTEGTDFRYWLRVLWARKWTVFGTLVLVTAGFWLHSSRQTPIYKARCTLLIEPRTPNLLDVQRVIPQTGTYDYYKTQWDLLRSKRIGRLALDRMESDGVEPLPSISGFVGSIEVNPGRDSRLVYIGFESPHPDVAQAAANAIVKSYIEDSKSRISELTDKGLATLREKEAQIRPKYEAAQAEFKEFARQGGFDAKTGKHAVYHTQLTTLRGELATVRTQLIRIESTLIVLDGLVKNKLPADLAIPREDLVVITEYKMRLGIAEEKLSDMVERGFLPGHPARKQLEKRITFLKKKLDEARLRVVRSLKSRQAVFQTQEKALAKQIDEIEVRVNELNRATIKLSMLRQQTTMMRETHQRILRRIEELQLASMTSQGENNLFIIETADRPKAPIRPNPKEDLMRGAMIGLFAGIALAILLEFMDTTLKTKESVEQTMKLPVLGHVPPVDPEFDALDQYEPGMPAELVSMRNAHSTVAESFRTIRTGLGFTLPADGPRTLLVTSASAGEGKSFVSLNLALALARAGSRVLLIDADLRKPKQHKLLELESEFGLSTTLTAMTEGEPVSFSGVQESPQDGLHILPAGPNPHNPAELVSSNAMRDLVDAATEEYDWVIVDAPPVNTVADPAAMMAHVPHTLFVVRPFSTTVKSAKRAREMMSMTPARAVGVVLNNVDVPASRDELYRDRYYYYAYSARASAAAAAAQQPHTPGNTGNGGPAAAPGAPTAPVVTITPESVDIDGSNGGESAE